MNPAAAAMRLRLYLDAIKFEHTIFALPFAFLGMVLAQDGWPGWRTFLWITVAMAGARTGAMAANRLIDAKIDAANPRTAERALPAGRMSRVEMLGLASAGFALLHIAAWQLNLLALALAHTYPRAEVIATDISPAAVELARENIRDNHWEAGRIDVREGDLFDAVPCSLRGEVDIVVSNPPYVAESEWSGLPAEVRTEPYGALVAGPRGTEILERLAAEVGDWLRPSGTVAVEIGETQAEEVQEAFRAGGIAAKIHNDLAGRSRFVWGGPIEP